MNDLLIIDGHAHTYDDTIASRVIASFTEYHRMEPTGSIGTGTVQDLLSRMSKNGIAWTVTANFAPRKSVERINAWSLKTAEEHKCFIPLVCVYPDMTSDDIRRYMAKGAKGIKMHTGIQGFEPEGPGLNDIYEYFDILPRLKPWDSFGRERHHIGQKASVIAVVQEGFITRSQQ